MENYDFDDGGNFVSYWECSLDEEGKELTGGGIGQVEHPNAATT